MLGSDQIGDEAREPFLGGGQVVANGRGCLVGFSSFKPVEGIFFFSPHLSSLRILPLSLKRVPPRYFPKTQQSDDAEAEILFFLLQWGISWGPSYSSTSFIPHHVVLIHNIINNNLYLFLFIVLFVFFCRFVNASFIPLVWAQSFVGLGSFLIFHPEVVIQALCHTILLILCFPPVLFILKLSLACDLCFLFFFCPKSVIFTARALQSPHSKLELF